MLCSLQACRYVHTKLNPYQACCVPTSVFSTLLVTQCFRSTKRVHQIVHVFSQPRNRQGWQKRGS
ncbi:unnamed protein product [Brassica napus]|uniref:(rape) hypothetical protein n=1 Tax=Brassica napus TaxID=3708 RepID=A0A816SMY2_BRANA|nr:unnamed protein product [Brassica napus]